MTELKEANIDSFKDLEEAIKRYNMLICSYNLDQRIIASITDCNKQWLQHYAILETKSVNKIIEYQDRIEKLEEIVREKDLTIEELEEQVEMYRDNPEGSEENNYE